MIILFLSAACVRTEPATQSVAQTPSGATASSDSTVVPSTVTSNPTEMATTTRETASMPVFIRGDCRFSSPTGSVDCGDLIVAEDRGQPDGATVTIHVAIFHSYSSNPEPDPVVYLMGGGGGDALGNAAYYLNAVGNTIRASRDFIMYNQRGTRYDEPFLECPGEAVFMRALDAEDISQEESDDRTEAFMLECHNNLVEQGIDLSLYNSVTNADDLNDLRIALGYEQVNYYGTSYGTRLGLTLMRYHPDGIRSVILDSVLPPQVDYPSEVITSFMGAVNRIFESCSENKGCRDKYPQLEETFFQVIDELDREPVSIQIDDRNVIVDDDLFLDSIYIFLHPATALPDIPYAIYSAHEGNFEPLEWAFEYITSYSDSVATGVFYSSVCREEVVFDSYENTLTAAADYAPQVADFYAGPSFYETCEWWQSGEADPVENEPVISDIPTLIFSGYYDPITSPQWGQRAAETLSNSYSYEFPNMGHGVMRSDECAKRIGIEFLDDPWNEPDASCIDRLTSPDFK
jgi:pimeloyl-ACP methyl ester carboxylesterase